MKPLAIDLYCGLGGWSDGLLAEGYDCIGFDIERHDYGTGGYPGQLVLQDVMTLHGTQFRNVDLIVASPPCQAYSYMAMPWSRAKAIAAEYRSGVRSVEKLNALFVACFRIQREACLASGRHIPLIVENVRGAIPWVGRSRWNYGSYHLWGDVPALMPIAKRVAKVPGLDWNGSDKPGYVAQAFNDGSGKSFQTASVHRQISKGWRDKHYDETDKMRLTNQRESDAVKGFKDFRDCPFAQFGSKSSARKAASAQIAKIPYELARFIAYTYHPRNNQSKGISNENARNKSRTEIRTMEHMS